MSRPTRSVASEVAPLSDKPGQVLEQYGYVSNTFDHARDPLISKQLNDDIAARRTDENRGENSWMISKEQPRHLLRPPEEIARPVGRALHNKIMAEEHERAMIAQAESEIAWQDQQAEKADSAAAKVMDDYGFDDQPYDHAGRDDNADDYSLG